MSKITVTTIAGATSGADANKVKIESGDTLEVQSNATVGGDLTVDTSTLKVDSSNNRVGIGTASPAHKLEVHSANATNIVAKSTNGNGGYLNYSGLSSGGTTTFSVTHNGNVYAADGINLGGTGSANRLDDYEEGTHTITFTNIAANPTSQGSTYVKIGNVVNYIGTFTFPSTSDTNDVNISLPFVSDDRNGIGVFLSNGANDKILFTGGAGTNYMRVYPDNSFSQNNYNSFSGRTFYFTITYQTTA